MSARTSVLRTCSLIAVVTTGTIVALGGEAAAQGGPPMMTDDTGTPGDGKWENNVALILESSPPGRVLQLPVLDVNYGLGARIQLNYQVGVISRAGQGQPRKAGLTQQGIGVKWRFVDGAGEKSGVSVSTYPKVGVRGPGSSSDSDLTPVEPQEQLPVEVRVGLGDVAMTTDFRLQQEVPPEARGRGGCYSHL